MDFSQMAKDANAKIVWDAGEFPEERYEAQIRRLAMEEDINRNWLEEEARERGVDFDEDMKDEFNRVISNKKIYDEK